MYFSTEKMWYKSIHINKKKLVLRIQNQKQPDKQYRCNEIIKIYTTGNSYCFFSNCLDLGLKLPKGKRHFQEKQLLPRILQQGGWIG